MLIDFLHQTFQCSILCVFLICILLTIKAVGIKLFTRMTFWILQIAKDARECVQECVSEFISFITSEASDRCHTEKRKTINGEDILYAMTTLGFDNYVEPLKMYLQKYREVSLTLQLAMHEFYIASDIYTIVFRFLFIFIHLYLVFLK